MTDEIELSDEERALLAADDKPAAEPTVDTESAPEPEVVPEPTPEPTPEPKSKAKKPKSEPESEPVEDAPATPVAEAGNPEIPVQMDYGDPWGFMPVQMRHDAEGNPVA